MKKTIFATTLTAALAATLIATLALVSTPEQQAFARPPLDDPTTVGDHVMKINLKGVPNTTNRACDGSSSNNIYTPFGTNFAGHQHILWDHFETTANVVVDHCTEALDGDAAKVELLPGVYVFTIRMLGPPTAEIKYCSQLISIHDDPDTHCVLGDFIIVPGHIGKPGYTVPKNLFDDATEDQIWSLIANTKFRNAQIDIWEAP